MPGGGTQRRFSVAYVSGPWQPRPPRPAGFSAGAATCGERQLHPKGINNHSRGHDSHRSPRAGSGPAFSNTHPIRSRSLTTRSPFVDCDGAALRAAVPPKCKPFGSSDTQRAVPTHARPAPPAGACLSPPRSQQLKMDVISRTSCARTHVHTTHSPADAAGTRARAWTFPYCTRFAGRAFRLRVPSLRSFTSSSLFL